MDSLSSMLSGTKLATPTITSLKLKDPFRFLKIAGINMKVTKQLKSSEGFVQYKSTGMFTSVYTMSLWRTEKDLKNFAQSGAHRDAIKRYREVAHEVRTLTLAADKLPDWPMAKDMLKRNGKVID